MFFQKNTTINMNNLCINIDYLCNDVIEYIEYKFMLCIAINLIIILVSLSLCHRR